MADQSEVAHVEQEGNEEFYQILSDFIKRRDAGEEVDVEEYCKEHPEHASALRSYSAGDGLLNAMLDEADEKIPLHLRSSQSVSARGVETVRPGAAHATDTPMKEEFGRYRLVRMLGEGAMGAIYLAEDKNLEREVALKVPKLTGMEGADFLQRFSREAKAAARLDHPFICRVYDADEHEGTPYITMAFIDGQPLTRFIGTPEFDDQRRVVEMVRDIANGLEHAHQQKILHRDLKPGNVLVQPDGTPCITDFGLARRVDTGDESRITKEGSIIGTPAYMSPEQIEGHQNKIHATADVYSLGVIFYELLTKQLPFQGSVMSILGQAMRDRPKPISKTRGDVDPDLEQLCLKMLEKNNGDRPGSMKAIVDELDKWLQKTPEDQKATEAKVKRQKGQLEANKAKIQELIDRGQYAAAIKGLEKLAAIKNPNAKEYIAWAKKKLPEVRAMPETLQKGMASLVATADKFIERNDYAQAAELLSKIPPNQRTEKVQKLLDEAIEYQDEADLLLADLKDCVKRRQYKGIMDNLDRFLELKPGNKFANDLHRTLTTYGTGKRKKKKFRFDSKGRLLPAESGSIWDSFAVMGTLMFLVVFGGASWGIMIYLGDSDQQIAVKIDEQWLKDQGGKITLSVDGNEHTITGPGINIKVALGKRGFSVKNGDTVVYNPENFTIEKDGRKILHIDATGMHFGTKGPDLDPSNEATAANDPVGINESDTAKDNGTDPFSVIRQPYEWKTKYNIEGLKYHQVTEEEATAILDVPDFDPFPMMLGDITGKQPTRNYHWGWYDYPDFLIGAAVFGHRKPGVRFSPILEFTVKKDHTLYFAATWHEGGGVQSEQQIIDDGWELTGHSIRGPHGRWRFFRKDAVAGESFKFHTGKGIPLIIVPSTTRGNFKGYVNLCADTGEKAPLIAPMVEKVTKAESLKTSVSLPPFLDNSLYYESEAFCVIGTVNRKCEVYVGVSYEYNSKEKQAIKDLWKQEDFIQNGWKVVAEVPFKHVKKKNVAAYTFFRKMVVPGDVIRVLGNRTNPPVLFVKPASSASAPLNATLSTPGPAGVIRQVSEWKYKSSIEGIKYKQLTPVDAMAVISHTTMAPVPLELGLIDGTPPNKGNNNNIHGHYEIPDFLRGACIFISPKNGGRLNPVTEFTVKKDTTIYITCNWDYVIGPRLNSATGRKTEQEIIASGWQPAGSMLRITGFHQKIFKRDVKAGETYKIQYDSASPPYVIVPSPDPGPKGTVGRLIPTEDSDDLFIGPNIKKIVPIQQFLDMRKRPQFLEDFTYVKQPFSYAYFVVNRPCEVVLAARCDENDPDYWTEQDFNSKGWQDRGSTDIRVFGKPLTHTLFYKQCRPGELIWIRSRKTSPEIFVKPIGSAASSASPPAVQTDTKVAKPEGIRQPSDWKVVSSIEGIDFQQVSVQEAKDVIACEMLDPIPLTLGKLTGGGPNVGISTISGGWYEIPAELRGAAIFQSQRLRGRISPITEFRVKKNGIIYLAAGSPRHRRTAPNSNREFDLFEQKMKNQKWEFMGSMLRISSQGSVCFRHRLYKKHVTAGEKYRFQSDSFVPPFVIVPSNNPGKSDVVTRWLPAPDSSDIVIAPGCRHIYRSDKSPSVLPVGDSEVLLSPPDSLKGTYYYKQQVPGAYAIVNKPCQVYVTIEPSPQHEKLWWTDADFAKDGWKKLQEVTAVRGENKIPQTLFMKTCKPGDVIDVAGDPIPRSFMFVRPLAN